MTEIKTFEFRLEGGVDGLPALMHCVENELNNLGIPLAIVSKYEISVEEIVLNTLKHGSGEALGSSVFVSGSWDGEWVELIVRDNANPFNPLEDAPQPQVSASLEEREIGGLGIYLVLKMMDEMHYRYEDNQWNNLTMRCRCA